MFKNEEKILRGQGVGPSPSYNTNRLRQAEQACETSGYADCGTGGAQARTTIHSRIDQALAAYELAAKRANAAIRARQILEQHPEYAELLDALSEF